MSNDRARKKFIKKAAESAFVLHLSEFVSTMSQFPVLSQSCLRTCETSGIVQDVFLL